jgi:hypothetical protein
LPRYNEKILWLDTPQLAAGRFIGLEEPFCRGGCFYIRQGGRVAKQPYLKGEPYHVTEKSARYEEENRR